MESYARSGYFHWAPLLFSLLSIMHWIFTPPPPAIHVEIQIPNAPVLGDGTLVKWLDHEGRSLMDGISALINNIPESWPPLPPHIALLWTGRKPFTDTKSIASLILDILSSRTMKSVCSLNYLVYGILLKKFKWSKTLRVFLKNHEWILNLIKSFYVSVEVML